jgi:hypothetical protein
MEDVLKFGECYICLEDTPLLSQCDCVERYLCENCVLKLQMYNYKECTVCKVRFPMFLREDSIEIDFDDLEPERYVYKPWCCRKRNERRNPKYCLVDMLFHTVMVIAFTFSSSCLVRSNHLCYSWNAVDFFLPSLVAYTALCMLTASLCK